MRKLLGTVSVLAALLLVVVPEPCWGHGTPVVYPRLLLQTPYTVMKLLGKPDQVVDGPAGTVEWRYLAGKHYDPRRDALVGKNYLSCFYLRGRMVELRATPAADSGLSSKVASYVPGDARFKVKSYDSGEHNAHAVVTFSDALVHGTLAADCPPLRGEKLVPSGLYEVSWNFSRLWKGRARRVRLSVDRRYLSQLRQGGKIPASVTRAVAQLPVHR